MASLFEFVSNIFGGSSQLQDDNLNKTASKIGEENCDLTGVAKYLRSQKSIVSVTGVTKYLKTKEGFMLSGVAKYLAKQSIISKQKNTELSEIVTTGVEKYLYTHANKPQTKLSGVTQYLANHHSHSMSSVAKYIAKKIIATRTASSVVNKTTGVDLYLENRKEVLTTGVGKYIARKVLVTKQLITETVSAVESITQVESMTGVEKYLQAKSI
jgi:hypothetical protein